MILRDSSRSATLQVILQHVHSLQTSPGFTSSLYKTKTWDFALKESADFVHYEKCGIPGRTDFISAHLAWAKPRI